MGWDGMGWDGMGWDGMGWDGCVAPGTLRVNRNVPLVLFVLKSDRHMSAIINHARPLSQSTLEPCGSALHPNTISCRTRRGG